MLSKMDCRCLFVTLLFSFQCFDVEASIKFDSLIEMGRSVAGFISSGINDFSEIRRSFPTSSNREKSSLLIDKEGISIDDLFDGLSEVWNVKEPNGLSSEDSQTIDSIDDQNNINDDDTDGLIYEPQNFNEIIARNIVDKANITRVENNESEETKNHWMRIKVIVENMKSLFIEAYGKGSREKFEIIDMIDKMLSIGDKINLVKNIEDSFDQDLLQFLYNKWTSVQNEVLNKNPLLKTMLSIDGKVLLLTIAKGLVKQFGKTFHQKAIAHVKEQDFVIDTMRKSGFYDSEIYEVFELLDLPIDLLVNTSKTLKMKENVEGRGFLNVGTWFTKRGGGHGGGHGGGYGDGYGSMMKKDPLLLLAGLAFATFGAYLLYRLVSSTPPSMGRGFQDISFSLYMSDIPKLMTNAYQWLETTEKRYGKSEEELSETNIGTFISSVNNLWKSYQVDKTSKSCVRRFLCHFVQEDPFRTLRFGTSLHQLALLNLAELFGAKGMSKANDLYVRKLMEGKTTNCATDAPQCKDQQFSSVLENSINK